MNRLRTLLLSILILALVAGGIPVTNSLAKWSRRSYASRGKRHRLNKRHTRAWWRRHRARQRARRERAMRRRAEARAAALAAGLPSAATTPAGLSLLSFNDARAVAFAGVRPSDAAVAPRMNNAALSPSPNSVRPNGARPGSARVNGVGLNAASTNSVILNSTVSSGVAFSARSYAPAPTPSRGPRLPFDFVPPHNWGAPRRTSSGQTVFTVNTPEGRPAGTAVLAPVALSGDALADAPVSAKTKTVGRVPVTALRRTVIDRMVAEGGWVTNDFVREIQGRRVFVVVAQTGQPGAPAATWTFYFTELDGRVYSLATTTPIEFTGTVAAGSEQFMASLRAAAAGRNLATQK